MEKKNIAAGQFREIRATLGLTQFQLATLLSLSRNYIAKIETGKKEPSVRVLQALHALKLTGVEKENIAIYQKMGGREDLRGGEPMASFRGSRPPMRITPGHEAPAAEPTEQLCQEHLAEYLRRGRPIRGWVGHTYLELRDKFPLDRPERLKGEPQ